MRSVRLSARRARELAEGCVRHWRLLAQLAWSFDHGEPGTFLKRGLPERDVRRLVLRLLRDVEVRDVRFVRDGTKWATDLGDSIGWGLFLDGQFELDVLPRLLELIGDGTIVDVGANVGTTTVPLAQRGRSVIAIEPVPHTFALLVTNVEENRLTDLVRCVNQAILAQEGDVEMVFAHGSGQSEVLTDTASPAFRRWSFEERGRVRVPGGPLDPLLQRLEVAPEDVALVWSDTQGCETDVLVSGERLWSAGVPVYLELDPFALGQHGGVERFLQVAEAHFGGFLLEADVIAGVRRATPVRELRRTVAAMASDDFTNVLLLP